MTVTLRGNEIHIQFALRENLLDDVRSIPDRDWNEDLRVWTVPATSWHARLVIQVFRNKLAIGPDVMALSIKDHADWNNSDLDLSIGSLRPRPYQAGAVEFLVSVGGRGIIGDDIGLGKTIEAISYLRFEGLTKCLLVVPASVLYKWEMELARWYPEVQDKIQVIANGKTKIEKDMIHIISYDMMRRRYHELKTFGYEILVFDEFHKLRNYKTLQFQAAQVLARGVPKLVGLSGTPVFNRPKELYNMLHLIDGRSWQWLAFHRRYCGWDKRGDGIDGAFHLDELEERLRGLMIRRFKREVANQLPPFTRTVVPLHLPEQVMRDYRLLEREDPDMIRALFPEGKGFFVNELDWLAALRQFLERARAESVAEWAEDFLESSTGKLVIYCGYKSTVQKLYRSLGEYGVAVISGDVSNVKRQEVINGWQNTRNERVMLLTSAGGEGIDLFGKNGIDCSTILFAGREWSPAVEEQIEGRLDRTGQSFPVEAVYLVAQGTVDEEIHRLIEAKREIIHRTVRSADTNTLIVRDLVEVLARRGITKQEVSNARI